MDFQAAEQEILKSILKEESTIGISRDLGYKHNQVGRWLNGGKNLKWKEFVGLCFHLDIPIIKAIQESLSLPYLSKNEVLNIGVLIRKHFIVLSLPKISEKLNVSLPTLKRYISGKSDPDFNFVLKFLKMNNGYYERFCSIILGRRADSQIESELKKQELEMLEPIMSGIESCLALDAYKKLKVHDNAWIANLVGSTPEIVDKIIKFSSELGNCKFEGGKWVLKYSTVNTTGSNPGMVSRVARFWNQRATDRFFEGGAYNKNLGPNIFIYRVAPVSKASGRKITEALLKFNQELLQILESDSDPKEDVRVVLLNHFSISDGPLSN